MPEIRTKRHYPGMVRACARCDTSITVTEQMCKHGRYLCSSCLYAKTLDYIRRNPEKKREWNRNYARRTSGERADKTRSYRQRNPKKRQAHQAVQTALRNGSLTKGVCAVCGNVNVHAHHEDYDSPLDVIWLCHTHHMERHALIAASKSGGSDA